MVEGDCNCGDTVLRNQLQQWPMPVDEEGDARMTKKRPAESGEQEEANKEVQKIGCKESRMAPTRAE